MAGLAEGRNEADDETGEGGDAGKAQGAIKSIMSCTGRSGRPTNVSSDFLNITSDEANTFLSTSTTFCFDPIGPEMPRK